MTSNQIAYWANKEIERANREKERENRRHNEQTEYNQLIGNLDNVFSLGAHAAGGSPNLQEGLQNQLESITGERSLLDSAKSIFGNLTKQLGGNKVFRDISLPKFDLFNQLRKFPRQVMSIFSKIGK